MAVTDEITSPNTLTAEVSSGNPATVNDAAAKFPVGSAVYFRRADGAVFKCRYVQIDSTVPPVEVVGPVYWKNAARTIVTAVMSEGLTGTVNSAAGILLNKDITDGNYGFIQVLGPLAKMAVVANTAKGDAIIGAAAQGTARVAAGTAPTHRVIAWAEEDRDGDGLANVFVCAEPA